MSEHFPCTTVAIVAHVDHGKTTLLDCLLRQSGTLSERGEVVDRVMDSDPQERERGITIVAKCTAVKWHDHRIQIVDTPGHQDFGGEVERILRMVDSVLLVVDAVEGPMPQTRYVLRKALEHGYRPVVVVNKMDWPRARPAAVLDQVFESFDALGADDEQLDFPTVYASAKVGWASVDPEQVGEDMGPLFDAIIRHVTPCPVAADARCQFQVSTLDYSDYLGRIAIGRVHAGTLRRGMQAVCCRRDGTEDTFRVTKLMGFSGLERIDADEALAGEIVALAGVDGVTVGETICEAEHPNPLPMIPIDQPTIMMLFGVNTSPFAGREGKFVTGRHLRERLQKELEHNVGLRIEPCRDGSGHGPESWKIYGRGTLHLSVMIETMRREGYEMTVGQPQVVMRGGEEPYELAVITVPREFAGAVIEKLARRCGSVVRHEVDAAGVAQLEIEIPSRGLIGYRSEFLTDTRGEGIMHHAFARYGPRAAAVTRRENGAMIVQVACDTVAYGLNGLQERGRLFVGPQEQVYAGQVIGLHSRSNDLVVNPGKKKQLSNMRASGHDENYKLTPPTRFSLEEALEMIDDDELVEVTPQSVRIRKRLLDHNQRDREFRQAQKAV